MRRLFPPQGHRTKVQYLVRNATGLLRGSRLRNCETVDTGPTTSPHEQGGRGNGVTRSLPSAVAESGDHGLPQRAVEIARPFGFPITNSMIVSWIVAVGLITFARAATRDMKRVPGGAQNRLECAGSRSGWFPQRVVRTQGRQQWLDEGADDRRVLRRRLLGDSFHHLPAGLPELPSLRQRLCRGKHAGSHVPGGSQPRVAAADSVLFHGIARGPGAGPGLHVVVRGLHSACLSAWTTGRCGHTPIAIVRRHHGKRKENDMTASLHVGLAALGAALGVGLIGMKASEAVGRNPGAATQILVQSILAIAFAEAIVFYALFLVR